MLYKVGIILLVLLVAALTLGCTVPVETNPGDPATINALSLSKNTALNYVTAHQFYNSIVVETPAHVVEGYIASTESISGGYMRYYANVYVEFNESRFNQSTGVYMTVPHRVFAKVDCYGTNIDVDEAAMDGEYDLVRFRPLLGGSGWK